MATTSNNSDFNPDFNPKFSVGDFVVRTDGRHCDKFFRIDKIITHCGCPHYELFNLEDNCPFLQWVPEGFLEKVNL